MNFKTLNTITALIAFTLFLTLLVFPQIIFYLFQIAESDSAVFMSHRASMLFLSIGVLAWLIRHSVHPETRRAISISFMVMMFGLAALGSIEYFLGHAGIGIFLAVITEVLLGVAYLKLYSQDRH